MVESRYSRRDVLKAGAAVGTGVLFGSPRCSADASTKPTAKVREIKVISQTEHYSGWPTLTRRKNGQLWVVCSGGREAHVCPFGRVEAMTSNDDGETWTWPRVLSDGPIDDRDAGIVETNKGSLLVTTFTSLAYKAVLAAAKQRVGKSGAWSAAKMQAWLAADARITPAEQTAQLGVWMLRSTDGGIQWSAPYRCLVNSPHGPIQLADGRQLYAGKELWTKDGHITVAESRDDGVAWKPLARIPTRKGDDHRQYHELHAVETAGGTLIAHIRNHNSKHAGETLQSESSDGGRTWTEPHSIGVWGLPSFLTRLSDGRLLMSYGHRRPPFGNQARLSSDDGKSWSEPLMISTDGAGGDLGYPSTVELEDKSLLTIWYEKQRGSTRSVLRQARWNIA